MDFLNYLLPTLNDIIKQYQYFLSAILPTLNDITKQYQYLFSAIGSLATVFAVYLALRKPKPKIQVEFIFDTKNKLTDSNQQFEAHIICAEIINLDSMPIEVQLNSFRDQDKQILCPIDYIDESGYPHPAEDLVRDYYIDRISYSWNPLENEMKKYPFLIKAGESKKFYLFAENEFMNKFLRVGFCNKIPIKMNLFFLIYRPKVIIYNKFVYRVGLSKNLKSKIKKKIIK
jgi:hypothetical protein